jgi:hypothetical protein
MKEEGPRMLSDDEEDPEEAIAALMLRRGKLTPGESAQLEALCRSRGAPSARALRCPR